MSDYLPLSPIDAPVVYVDANRVHIEDFGRLWDDGWRGQVIRVDGDPSECVMHVISSAGDDMARVAGAISEDA